MLPSADIKELTLRDYLEVIRKRLWIVLLFVLVITSFVVLRDFKMIPLYRATVSILIDERSAKIVSIQDVYETPVWSQRYYPTEYNILKTRVLADRVFNKLNLSSVPEFQTANPSTKLLNMVSIEPVKGTKFVLIAVTGADPVMITKIVNTWAQEYILQDVEKRVDSARYATTWLEDQLGEIKQNLNVAEENMQKFIKENRIVTVPDIERKTESLLEDLKKQKISLEKQWAELSKRYKERHPTMITLASSLSSVTDELERETERNLDLQEKMVRYRILKREVDTYQTLYDSLLTRSKEVDISEKLENSNIRIVDTAEVPKYPVAPQKAKDISLAFLVSLMLGIGFCFFLEYIDSTLKTSEDVEFYVKIPFLSYIQLIRGKEKNDLVCALKNTSQVAESFRNLRVSLLFSSPEDKPLKNLVVSSAIPGEGKTFVSINLATTFAQAGERTVLIDADMRRGRVHKAFRIDNKKGLSSVLAGVCSLEDALIKTEVDKMSLIPCGPYAPNPAELLNSMKLTGLFEELKKRYDRIIVDSPPVLTVADTLILASLLDGIVYVIRAKYTQLKLILEAKRRMIETRAKTVGVVLNSVDLEEDKYYYYHYYYSSYYLPEGGDGKRKKSS